MSQDQTHSNPRLAVLRDLTRGDGNDLWRLALLDGIDAVDPLRKPVSMDPPAAADPTMALARLFAKIWNFNPPVILGVAIEYGLVEAISGPGNSNWQPTDLGRAALALAERG